MAGARCRLYHVIARPLQTDAQLCARSLPLNVPERAEGAKWAFANIARARAGPTAPRFARVYVADEERGVMA